MKNIKILAVVLAGFTIQSNAVGATEVELETFKNQNVKGLIENLQNWDVLGSVGSVISVVWDTKGILSAAKDDVVTGNAFTYLSAATKEARKSGRLIVSYPAFACDVALSATGATYTFLTNPRQSVVDVKEYGAKLAYAEWLVLTDPKIVAGLNDADAVTRLLATKED